MPGGGQPYGTTQGGLVDLTHEAGDERTRWQRIWDWIEQNVDINLIPDFLEMEDPSDVGGSGSNQGGGTLGPPMPGYGGAGGGVNGGEVYPPGFVPPFIPGPNGPVLPPGLGNDQPQMPGMPQAPGAPQGPMGPGAGMAPRPRPPGRPQVPPMLPARPPWQWRGPANPWRGPAVTVNRGGGPRPLPPWANQQRLF